MSAPIIAVVGRHNVKTLSGGFPDAQVCAYPEVPTEPTDLIVVSKWSPPDEKTYGVSAFDWNGWVYGALRHRHPSAQITVL